MGANAHFKVMLELVIGLSETLPHLAITLIPAVSTAVSCLPYREAALGLGDIQQAEGRRDVAQSTGNCVGEFSATAQLWFDRNNICVCAWVHVHRVVCPLTGGTLKNSLWLTVRASLSMSPTNTALKCFASHLKTLTLMLRHGFYV